MPTFGIPLDSFSCASEHASLQAPDIDINIVAPSELHRDDDDQNMSSDDSGFASGTRLPPQTPDELIREAQAMVQAGGDYPLVATQPLTQSQPWTYNADYEEDLIGCLIRVSGNCERFELFKHKGAWTIGRFHSNDLVLPGNKLSNFHCKLQWNGKSGKQSELLLADSSTNGTWVDNRHVLKSNAIVRGGAVLCFGAKDVSNEWTFIYRDIEGQAGAQSNQIWAKYDISHELGSGAFARVHKCIERDTGKEFAVKIIDRTKMSKSNPNKAIQREIGILQQLAQFRHKHIVKLYEWFEEENSIYLILELVPGGDLLTYMAANGPLPEFLVRRLAVQMCHAVAYVHSQGIAHRDLKPENVIMTTDEPPNCKVADFGLAKLVGSGTFLKTMCGTPVYLAPEVMLRQSTSQAYDNKVDSWSLGIIFFCMLTNNSPFLETYDPGASPTEMEHYFGVRKVQFDLLDTVRLSEDGHDFMRHLLAEDPRTRKTVAEMLNHAWLAPLVPSESQFQRPPESGMRGLRLSDSPERAAVPPPVGPSLSQMPIPGLSMLPEGSQGPGPGLGAGAVGGAGVGAGASTASSDVTRHIPGAFPASGGTVPAAPGLPQIAETETGAASSFGVKRKNVVVGGSSPLSSLSDLEEAVVPAPARRPPVSRKRGTGAGVGRRRGGGAAGGGVAEERPPAAMTTRRSARHATKAARRI